MNKKELIALYKKYNPRFELLPNEAINLNEALAYYKLKLKAYSKKRFDPFCRWQRITIPYGIDGLFIETTIGQLNFFKWAIENEVIDYIRENYKTIENDMNNRNSNSKKKKDLVSISRKKREELSVSAFKTIKKENVEIVVSFN